MTPYYDREGVTIYNARWEDVWPTLGLTPSDVALCWADPPYGIAYQHGAQDGRPKSAPIIGDDVPYEPAPLLAFYRLVSWGANHYANRLPNTPAWWTWDKREGTGAGPDQSDCEHAWTNIGNTARLFSCMWSGASRRTERGVFIHPTQKPVALCEWGFKRAGLQRGDLVFSPYLGSGPEVRAALNMGLRIIGCEVVEAYCDAVVKHRTGLARHVEGQGVLFGDTP